MTDLEANTTNFGELVYGCDLLIHKSSKWPDQYHIMQNVSYTRERTLHC